jgi:hypothetical protein
MRKEVHRGKGHCADRGGERERETRHEPRHTTETVHGVCDPGNRHGPEDEPEEITDDGRVLRLRAVERGEQRDQRDRQKRKNREVRKTQREKET